MKKMKKSNILLAAAFLGLNVLNTTKAQTNIANPINEKSFWQISARAGYDFPTYKEDFKYIDYKGGMMAGLSINKYWNNWGFQVDGDYIKNSVNGNITEAYYRTSTIYNPYIDIVTTKKDITRMFFGAGPAYKYQSPNNKFTLEAALMGGIGIVNGGEILVEGQQKASGTIYDPLTYHSGFDNAKMFTGKAQLRVNYFFTPNFGLHAGAYYMNHFGGALESQKNQILNDRGYDYSTGSGAYFAEQQTSQMDTNNGITNVFNGEYVVREFSDLDSGSGKRQKIGIQSLGVFAGITFKFGPKTEKTIVTEAPKEIIYHLEVTAKDKYTGQILPNTDVKLIDGSGNVLQTARTNENGIVLFQGITPSNYNIDGSFNEIDLDNAQTAKSEFVANGTLKKTILYSDRSFIIKGKTFTCNSTEVLPGVSVYLENNQRAYKQSSITDNTGTFTMKLPENAVYKLYGKKNNYFSQVEEVNANNYNREKNLFVNLEICAQEAKCGEAIALQNILYDLNKFFIREDAKPELDKLVTFLNDNPTVKVELMSHTDSRASDSYNLKLSQNRANAAVEYIISKGIDRGRISAKGYGETQLLNNCGNGSNCTEAEHQLNRRTEFKVICPK